VIASEFSVVKFFSTCFCRIFQTENDKFLCGDAIIRIITKIGRAQPCESYIKPSLIEWRYDSDYFYHLKVFGLLDTMTKKPNCMYNIMSDDLCITVILKFLKF